MRVVREVPQAKTSLMSGTLNLATLSQAQTFLNQEKKYNNKSYSKTKKFDLIVSLENKSKKECEKLLIERSPDLPKPERVRQITTEQTQITITLNSELISKLEELKSIYSHSNSNATYAELLEIMADRLLRKKKVNTNISSKVAIEQSATEESTKTKSLNPVIHRRNTAKPPGAFASRYIPNTIKQKVFIRDKGCCTYKDHKTNQRCNSRHSVFLWRSNYAR